jgi:hypothetical protein
MFISVWSPRIRFFSLKDEICYCEEDTEKRCVTLSIDFYAYMFLIGSTKRVNNQRVYDASQHPWHPQNSLFSTHVSAEHRIVRNDTCYFFYFIFCSHFFIFCPIRLKWNIQIEMPSCLCWFCKKKIKFTKNSLNSWLWTVNRTPSTKRGVCPALKRHQQFSNRSWFWFYGPFF